LTNGVLAVTLLTEKSFPLATFNTSTSLGVAPDERTSEEQVIIRIPWFCVTPGRYLLEVRVVEDGEVVGGTRIPSPIVVSSVNVDDGIRRGTYGEGRVYLHCEWEIRPAREERPNPTALPVPGDLTRPGPHDFFA
jgi:hypothetical protein